jgi:hypothetical protein
MRVLAATSGAGAQGATTDAGEAVGEISLGGSISFMIFAGILVPVAVALPFVAFRWFLPNISWVAGLAYGVILLGVLGVDDPLAPDNRDFFILSPTWLAVALVSATALLFGMTFAALSAKLDAALSSGSRPGSKGSWRQKSAYASLIFLVNPFLAPIAAVYVAGRAVSRGRLGRLLEVAPLRLAGRVIVAVLTITALAMVVGAAADIL